VGAEVGQGEDPWHGLKQARLVRLAAAELGVPITIIRCSECGEFVTDDAVLDGIVRLVEENGRIYGLPKVWRSFFLMDTPAKNAA